MANRQDINRKWAKADAVIKRLAEIHECRELLIGMLDEGKLDMLVLALGIGVVELNGAVRSQEGMER